MEPDRDAELIHNTQVRFAQRAEKMLREMARPADCICQAPAGQEHHIVCPVSIWFRAARAVRLLAEEI